MLTWPALTEKLTLRGSDCSLKSTNRSHSWNFIFFVCTDCYRCWSLNRKSCEPHNPLTTQPSLSDVVDFFFLFFESVYQTVSLLNINQISFQLEKSSLPVCWLWFCFWFPPNPQGNMWCFSGCTLCSPAQLLTWSGCCLVLDRLPLVWVHHRKQPLSHNGRVLDESKIKKIDCGSFN